MVTELNGTLYGAIKDHAHFEKVVLEAVELGLKKLGNDIHKLDWASISSRSHSTTSSKAA
jgi:hypothetical protein